MEIKDTDQELKGSDPNIERAEDTAPIRIQADSDEERMEKIDRLVKDRVKVFEEWMVWRKPFEDMWNEIYTLFFGQQDRIKTPTRAKINIPIIFTVIESALPKLMTIIFGNDRFWDFEPTNKADQPQAEVIKILINYQLAQADFFVKYVDFAKQLLLYGTSYFYVYWKVTRKWVFTRVPKRRELNILGWEFGKVLEWEEKREYKVVERRPEIEVLDILDVVPDPEARTEKDADGIFVQTWINLDDLKALGKGKYPVYANTDSEKLSGSDKTFGTLRQVRRSVRGVSNVVQSKENQVHLMTFWGDYDLDDDGIKEAVQIVIGNKTVLLRATPNGFHHQKSPVIRGVLFPVPMEWYGLGLVEPIITLVHELNTLRRQRLDNINMALNRMWKVISTSDVELETLVSAPNAIILVDDPNDVTPLETNDVTSHAYTEAAMVQQEIENSTVPKSIQGTPDSGRLGRTAKGAQLIINQALEKFGTSAKYIEEIAIKRVLRMMHQLNLQFIDNDDVLRDPGMYGSIFEKQVTPEMIRAEGQFVMHGISDVVGKEGKINQIMSFMGIFGKVLSPATITALAKKIWHLMGFDPAEVDIQAQQPMPPEGGGAVDQQTEAAVAGQLKNQGGGSPAAPRPNVQ